MLLLFDPSLSLLNIDLREKLGVRLKYSLGSDDDLLRVVRLLAASFLANRINSFALASHVSRTEVLGARRMNFVPVSMSYVIMLSLFGSIS